MHVLASLNNLEERKHARNTVYYDRFTSKYSKRVALIFLNKCRLSHKKSVQYSNDLVKLIMEEIIKPYQYECSPNKKTVDQILILVLNLGYL